MISDFFGSIPKMLTDLLSTDINNNLISLVNLSKQCLVPKHKIVFTYCIAAFKNIAVY